MSPSRRSESSIRTRKPDPSRSPFAFDRSRWNASVATRCAIGVAIPVAVAASTGHAALAALAALGALYAGIASYGGIYRARFRLMLGSAITTAASTTIGVWVGGYHALTLPALFLWGMLSALYAVSGPSASTLGVQACAVFIVFTSLGLPPSAGVTSGLAVLGGALTQVFLLTVVWPFNPIHPERTAVADAIKGLALFVAQETEAPLPPLSEDLRIPASEPFQDARSTLEQADTHTWGPEHDWLLQVIQRAEAVRAALVGWARADEAYRALRPSAEVRARRIGRSLHRALRAIAVRVGQGSNNKELAIVLRLPRVESSDPVSAEYAHWISLLKRLIHRFAEPPLENPPAETVPPSRRSWSLGTLFTAVTSLPDVASLRAVSFQHALRYATGICVATLLARLTGLSHAYWFPLTVALVLRPDFATTYIRGFGRIAGTLAGVLLASLFLDLFHPAPPILLVLMVVASWFAFGLFQTGYAAYSLAITFYVVFSVSASGVAPSGVGITRFLATLSGVLLSFLIYAVWPAWSWRHLWEVLRDAVGANVDYARNFAEGKAPERRAEIDRARVAARRLRIQSENLVRSASLDPLARRHKAELKAATQAIERLDRNAAEMLTIEAAVMAGVPHLAPDMNAVLESSENLESLIDSKLSDKSLSNPR